MENGWVLHLNKPHQRCCVLSMVEIGRLVLERKIFNYGDAFSLLCNYLPLEKGRALHLYKLDSTSAKGVMPILVKIGQVVLEKKIF